VDTTTSTLLSGTIVVVGRWAEDQPIHARIIIGIVSSAIALALLGTANAELAQAFGMIVLLTAVFRYGVPVLKKAGLIQ
jgi:hypothetical protein